MLEAAMFGGIPEGTGYRFPYTPHHQFMQNENHYPRPVPRPPSPSLQAQRLIREQQDDEYLASLAADREKEMKAIEEAEARRVQEEVARKAALEEERRKEEESRRKLEEEQEFERLLAAKEASLALEPSSNDENAVTLLVRMPDGSRRGRRFLKSDKLHALFDFIDIGRVVKPGTYRLVRPYPRRAFSDGEGALTLNELGLTSKQEALFLELI
nr:unknown [Populus trichocarpa]